MSMIPKSLIAALALAVAAPAAAQYTFTQPGQQPQPIQPIEVWNNVGRVNLGVGFYNSGWANCYYSYWYPYYPSCTSGSYTSYIPFVVGPQFDFNLGGMNNISVGFTVGFGSITTSVYTSAGAYYDTKTVNITLWEPTIDYVAKFGPATQDTVGRFRVGGGMYIVNSNIGGAFRIGGGASFLNANRLGVGVDLVLEGGGINGQWVGGLLLLVSPEVHF